MRTKTTKQKHKEDNKMKRNELAFEFDSAWKNISSREKNEVFEMAEDYKEFLNNSKTEREATREIIRRAEENGFKPISELIENNEKLIPGMKLYSNNRNKGVALFVIGKESILNGMNFIGAHIDSPRLDIKANPLYEDSELALLKTHYYGGLKKYQWVTIPLSLHGIVIKRDGSKVEVAIGEDENEPVFFITDLLPHLAKDQYEKKLKEAIQGEGLNIVVGSIPFDNENIDDRIKYNILNILNEKYGIKEEDFITAELEAVPVGKARDLGLDKGLIVAYAQDDKVCSYACLNAILEVENPDRTCMAIFVDKEEVGSIGNTGMQSKFFEYSVIEILSLLGEDCSPLAVARTLSNTLALSADVVSSYDPNFPDVFDKRNTAHAGRGVALVKETGSEGKNRGNDANSEYFELVRRLFDDNNVKWQIGELGKVDQEDNGTIAYMIAAYGIEVIDCGVPVLSMHAPYEAVSKVDVYMAYKGYKAFYLNK